MRLAEIIQSIKHALQPITPPERRWGPVRTDKRPEQIITHEFCCGAITISINVNEDSGVVGLRLTSDEYERSSVQRTDDGRWWQHIVLYSSFDELADCKRRESELDFAIGHDDTARADDAAGQEGEEKIE